MAERVEFCGAFNGSVTIRAGETREEALGRAEAAFQQVLDRHAKRLALVVGIDYSETGEAPQC